MYNYFGYTTFPLLTKVLYKAGLLAHPLNCTSEIFDYGVNEGIGAHSHILQLRPHSAVVDFVVKVRNKFLNEFPKYHGTFKGIDGEALFAGTVLHSLDHTLYARNIKDTLWLEADSTMLSGVQEM